MALSADRALNSRNPKQVRRLYPVAAGVNIYKGALIGVDRRAGQDNEAVLCVADVSASTPKPYQCVGIAAHAADNTNGSAGDLTIEVEEGTFLLPSAGLDGADVGLLVVADDDETFSG